MKHLILTNDFKPRSGGIGEYLHRLALELSTEDSCHVLVHGLEQGDHDPSYEVTYLKGRDRAQGQYLGDSCEVVRAFNTFLHLWGPSRQQAEELLEQEYSKKPDQKIRVYIGVWSNSAHFWCEWLKSRDIPYFIFAHGLEIIRERTGHFKHQLLEDFSHAKGVFANSEATADLLRNSVDIDEICVAYPGVTKPIISQNAEDIDLSLDIPSQSCLVLSICRLVERKGIANVLRALNSKDLRSADFKYVVAGSGPQLSNLRELTAKLGLDDRVDLLGFVDDETKWGLYELADLFVMPNSNLGGEDWEGFGIVFLEAAIMGTPAISGRSGGATEAVVHGETGYTVDPDSQLELEERLFELINNPKRREELGQAAQKRAEQEFQWAETARRVAEYKAPFK